MYQLTLTTKERRAIDWVGDRYGTGNQFYKLLWGSPVKATPDDADWNDPRDITFLIPEHIAWQINDLFAEDDYLFPCFNRDLTIKLLEFASRIV